MRHSHILLRANESLLHALILIAGSVQARLPFLKSGPCYGILLTNFTQNNTHLLRMLLRRQRSPHLFRQPRRCSCRSSAVCFH